MELTIDEALQQGVAAHKEGKLEDAERLYRAILQAQPAHPDANHNLGVLAVSINKADAALPLFKTAVDTNPKIEQFWLSYIDALIKDNQFKNAKQVLEQAKNQGVVLEKLNIFEEQLSSKNEPKHASRPSPSQTQLNSLLEHYQSGRFDEAEKLAVSITHEFPKHQLGWKALGALFGQSGRHSDAINANQKAVALSPQDAEAHYNLGVSLQTLGTLEEAEASFIQAIALNPDYAEAHSNLGATLREQGRLKESEASFRQAIVLKPDYDKAHSNLGVMLQELGRLDEAEASNRQAIVLKPDFSLAHYNLGITLHELGRLGEAEACFRQSIALKPDYAEAHSNLGITLKELDRLDEAEASFGQAIALKPDFALAYSNLGVVLYINGDRDAGLEKLEKANNIDPKLDSNQIIRTILKARKARGKTEVSADNISYPGTSLKQLPHPIILNRATEAELINRLYKIKSIELDKFDNSRISDPRYGDGKCS